MLIIAPAQSSFPGKHTHIHTPRLISTSAAAPPGKEQPEPELPHPNDFKKINDFLLYLLYNFTNDDVLHSYFPFHIVHKLYDATCPQKKFCLFT